MSRFLVTCWPLPGHVNNQLGIATALRERGHEVLFYTGHRARATVEGAGFEVLPFQHVDEATILETVAAVDRHPRERPDPRLVRRAFRTWLVESIPAQLADLDRVMARRRPDVIVCDLSMWGPIMVLWEREQLPVALSSTFMGPLIPGPQAPAWGFGMAPPHNAAQRLTARALTRAGEALGRGLRKRLDAIRADHGLGPMGAPMNAFTARLPLYLVGNIPALDYGRTDLPPSVHYVGPTLWHPTDPPAVSDWLAAVPTERPWVHVTESTITHGEPFLLDAAARGLAGAPVEAILTTGGHRDAAELGLADTAPNVHVTGWVSHAELLPRCSAVVTAGGAATVVAALRAGAPLVVVPTTWDKPDNARRVTEAGAGVRLSPRGCTPEALRAAVDEVLLDSRYAQRARELAAQLADTPGSTGAAELLEGLAPSGRFSRRATTAGGTAP